MNELQAGADASSTLVTTGTLGSDPINSPQGLGSQAQVPRGEANPRLHRWAGKAHQAIDKAEQTLSAKASAASSGQSRYGEKASAYQGQLREKIDARPLQAAAIAFAVGVVIDKLFLRRSRPRVQVVRVPVAVPVPASRWSAGPSLERRSGGWLHAAGDHAQGLAHSGKKAAGKLGATLGLGAAGVAHSVSRTAATLPLQAKLASQRALMKSQAYGGMARSGVQAHPLVGTGIALGLGALVVTLLKRR